MNTNDFAFDEGTTPEVENVLRQLYANKHRARFFWGDAETGRYWGDENDVMGKVGKSTGTRPCALLINNARSMGGGAILTACIVKIIDIDTRRTLYEHPTFENPFDRAELTPLSNPELPSYVAEVQIDGEVHARFTHKEKAVRWIAFMQGKRFSK